MKQDAHFHVLVIGGGHAGTEAALAAARLGVRTLLLTQNLDTIGQMSCNPSLGGVGKTHLLKEVDALDGIMARAGDHATVHLRVLNDSKGAAARATRAQIDRRMYRVYIQQILQSYENLFCFQQEAAQLLVEGGNVVGVVTSLGVRIRANTVVLTAGTFLRGMIYVGSYQLASGRLGDRSSEHLSESLAMHGMQLARLKTGTPPRLDGRTINYNILTEQKSDSTCFPLSYLSLGVRLARAPLSCWLTATNVLTHAIVKEGLPQSPIFTGAIQGVGPRYCPSIEDKVVRFTERESHYVFLEPDGWDTKEVYPSGISTSLPYNTQVEMIHSMVGLENAHILRPGYAIEYDYCDPRSLDHYLQLRGMSGLFCAGQINGTTGYEEAAAQGILAGANAALMSLGRDLLSLRRDQAYLGVLIDDLVMQGVSEPYRMFTSRAEFRLRLREDNADDRLTEVGYKIGLVSEARWSQFSRKQEELFRCAQLLSTRTLTTSILEKVLGYHAGQSILCAELVKRPEVTMHNIRSLLADLSNFSDIVVYRTLIDAKYAGYIARQQLEIDRSIASDDVKIPYDMCYEKVMGLSTEIRQKLIKFQPKTLAQARQISGMTPAAISLLLVYLKKSSLSSSFL